jgi:hypothetical protein
VVLGVHLRRLVGVVLGVQRVPVSRMRVLGGFGVAAVLQVPGSLLVMGGRVPVMLGRLLVVACNGRCV